MGDADYFLDLSSPDPLAEEVPSSVRPATRRITKSQHDLSSFPLPQSSPRRQSRAQSPRKRTFQLDVGDERSPQRIRVTVEAEEALKDHAVNRKLFPPPPSPTRSPRRRETITTTTVPLNDEAGPLDGPVSTPQKRGRPQRTSNGTPMPRGRKRAGTPIQRKSKQARQDDEPSSATGTLIDASTDMGAEGSEVGGGGEETPKPKTRTRKTPKKPPGNTPLPSSQVSGKTTGRKRGRPRKVPIPEESTVPTGDAAPSPPIPDSNIEFGLDSTLNTRSGEASSRHINTIDGGPTPTPPRQSNGIASSFHLSPSQVRTGTDQSSASPASSHQDMAENEDFMMSEDYQGTEPQSDLQSAEGEDGLTNHGQDTIADASDFSMIAVESLPSFQASFQASFHEETDGSPLDQHEMGEETSRIINQTLESLRHSLRTEEQSTSHAAEVENDSREVEDQNEVRDGTPGQASATTNQENRRGLWSSPRRVKNLPLSRQVFAGRGNVNDSFSSIPDSILHAATPGRPPVKTTNEHQLQGGENDTYNDSFSEVPEAVLEAATPGPVRQMETSTHISPERTEEHHETTIPPGQRSTLDYGSGRLPTPEETSSSNAGSGKAHDEDPEAALETEDQHGSVHHHTDVPSSPPLRTRPRALDFGYSNLQHELNTVQERLSLSPQRHPSGKVAANQVQSLEAPLSIARPSLSPIVRVGRTLQNVMSDNSSPENREVNLGSPFRGSASSDHPHQSLGAGSSSPSMRSRRALNNTQLSAGSPTRLDPNFRYNLDRKFGRVSQISGEIEDPAAPATDMSSKTEPLEEATTHQPSDPATLTYTSPMPRVIRMSSNTTDGEASWAAHDDNFQRIHRPQHSLQTADSHEPDAIETRGTNMSDAYPANADLYLKQDHGLHDEPVHDVDEEFSDRFEEHVSDDEDNGDDIDIWDIEASRASPNKPEPPRTTLKPLKPDVSSSRRSKVPSPWRRNNRRLIYKDDIASSSQIEIEESSQSEVEQYPPVRSRQRSPGPQPQKSPQRRSPDPVPVQKSLMTEDLQKLENTASPSPSHDDFEDYAGLADSEEPDDVIEHEEPVIPEQPAGVSDPMYENHGGHEDYGLHEDQKEQEEYEELQDLDMPTAPEASINISEYSLVAQQAKQTPKESKKPKSGFFGKFDILSFFSSPAVLPTDKSPGPNPSEPINKPTVLQPALETRQLKEPPRALWSTGLFPSVPQRGDAGPSFERRTALFSPGSALHSTDTVADTYEPSTSASPSPSRSPSASAAPSTPEHQNFPPIEQKRNFTPRLGQSRGSLFTTSQPASSTATDEANSDIRESSDEQESSALTEGSEYERVPPRDKPSQWDRNLSPTKSCFRSPLKPTTPGRIVAFSNSALSPLAQMQTRNIMGNSTDASNSASPDPPLRAPFEGKENQPHPHTQKITNANNNSLDKIAPQPSTASQEIQQPRALTSAPKSFALSQTTWSRHHWSRLDEMLQLRRRDPLRFQQVCALPPRNDRRSSVLLGKEVTAQDAHLILEQWHLDVVEAFKLEVGGWDEDVLAKRVFALIIGEEKRRATAQ